MNRHLLAKIIPILFLFFSSFVIAHHGNASHFDSNKTVNVEGQITRFAFTNPHVYIYFTVVNERGEPQEWRCESTAATALKRAGWHKESLKAGQTINVLGTPARREEHLCFANQIFINGIEYAFDSAPPVSAGQSSETQTQQTSREDYPLLHETGQPNISGYWYNPYFGRNRPTPYTPNGGYVRTDAGQAATDRFDDTTQSPALFCKPHNIIRAWGHDAHVNHIRQTHDKIYLQHGYMDFQRVIHLDQTEHPASIEPSTAGYSIGRWEGETLIVNTVGFKAGSIFPRDDVMHSDQLHTIERFHYNPETQQLERAYSVEDPLYLAETLNDIDYQVVSIQPYEPYACEHH